jgi:NADH dehydrogenase
LCSELGVRFVFVSSQSAAPDAPSHYGRAKFTAEQIVLAAGHTVVRPGLVYGEQERGLFGRLCGLVRSAPVLPRLWPDPPVQPVHVEDLCEAVARLLSQVRDGGRVYAIAGIEPLGFSAFLRAIAESWVRRPRPSLPVPSWLLRMVTGVPLGPAFAQMRSLYGLPALDARGSLDELGIVLRPLSEGLSMSKKQERRPLVREATAMLTYLLSRRPPLAATKRLMREFERSGTPFAPLLPPLLLRHPTLIGALDRPHAGPLRARLLIASCVAESSSIGYARFALITPVSRLYALIFLGRALGRVVLLTTLRPFVRLVAKAPAPVR